MRVGIIGLGAIGGVVAARLSARPAGLDLCCAGGSRAGQLTRLEVRGEKPVAVAVREQLEDGPFELILLCTRTDATEVALRPALPLLARDGAVVCLQNGLPEERAAAIVGQERVLGAVIGWSASTLGPGNYEVTGQGGFVLGRGRAAVSPQAATAAAPAAAPEAAPEAPTAAATDGRLQDARAVLERAFPVRVTGNLPGARWSKLALNCALSTLGAVTGFELGQLCSSLEARRLALRLIGEATATAQLLGVRLERISGLDPRWVSEGGPLPLPLAHALLWAVGRLRPRQRSGMLERLRNGRPEGQVDDLNGAVARAALAHHSRAPLNERLCALVHAIERGEEKQAPGQIARLASPSKAPWAGR